VLGKRSFWAGFRLVVCGLHFNASAAPEVNTLKDGLAGALGMRSDIAILGYDTVSYHTEGVGAKGDEKYAYEWKKAVWLFVNEANLELFKKDPEKYAPEYGGYCAFGLSNGGLHGIDPTKFEVSGGKLYLNNDDGTLKKWIKMADGKYKAAGDTYNTLTGQAGR
jgi:YHS domain-containing protein